LWSIASALADGPAIELDRLEAVCNLWKNGFTEKSASLHHVWDLPRSEQESMLEEVATRLETAYSVEPPSDVLSATHREALTVLGTREEPDERSGHRRDTDDRSALSRWSALQDGFGTRAASRGLPPAGLEESSSTATSRPPL